MQISESGDELAIRLTAFEWDALSVPVVRTNTRRFPRGEPRHGWPRWRRAGAPGRDALIERIETMWREPADGQAAIELRLARRELPGLVEILAQNRRVEGNLPMVPRELVAQMIDALRAVEDGRPVPEVESARLEREFTAHETARRKRREWGLWVFHLTRRRARFARLVLRLIGVRTVIGLDPHRDWAMLLDPSTALMLRAALSNGPDPVVVRSFATDAPQLVSPAAAREFLAVIADDLDEFLTDARFDDVS